MRFSVLGRLEAISDDGAGLELRQPRQRALLAVLLLHANQEMSVSRLTQALWDTGGPAVGPGALRTQIWALRKLLVPAQRLHTGQHRGYQLEVRPGELDTAEFRQLAGQGRHALESADLPGALSYLSEALALWEEPALADVPPTLAMGPVTQRLLDERAAVRELLTEARLGLGQHAELIPELRESAAADPANERLWEQLMLALHRAGRTAEALAAYRQARTSRQADLGLEPGRSLQQLHRRILADDPELAQRRTSPAAGQRQELTSHAAQELARATPRPVTARPAGRAPGGDRGAVPRQLPAAVRHFTGRQNEMETLAGLPGETAGTVVIWAIDGMPGIGKTALAVHAAHRLSRKYPDGQLFIDLHGYTHGHLPRKPGDALDWLLRALNVPPRSIPLDMDERAALYRARLADSRTLIVLDNAVSEEQVRPLLPGSAGCLVLVTSRRRLKGLDDAYSLALDVLPQADAITLLRTVAGPQKAPAGDPELDELAELCGRLPLALRISGALLRHRPAWPLEHLASQLRVRQQRISTLSDGDRDMSALFGLSYGGLTTSQQLLFRHLGLILGPDIDTYATAALIGSGPATASRLLESLVDHNLLIQQAPARYRLHDLIQLHARTLADQDPALHQGAALGRMLDYYLHTAERADALIARQPRPVPGVSPAPFAPVLRDRAGAWTWLRAERPNLLAAIDYAAAHGDHARLIGLTAGLTALLRADGPWPLAIARHTAVAHVPGDRLSRAEALARLGDVRALTGDFQGATRELEQALRLFRELGDQLGQANALTRLGEVRGLTSDLPGGARDLEEALQLYRDLGERLGQANALERLGDVRRVTCDFPDAASNLQEALQLFRDLDEPQGQANTLTRLGDVRRATGDLTGAVGDLQEALQLFRGLGERLGEANTLTQLGYVRRLTGDLEGAARDQHRALQVCRDLGEPLGQANALTYLGQVRLSDGDYPSAARHLEEAVSLFRRIGSRGSEAWALNHYAAVISATGDHARARGLYQDALHLARQADQPNDEALALEGIGECDLHSAETQAGLAYLEQALEIYQHLTMTPDTHRVLARLSLWGFNSVTGVE